MLPLKPLRAFVSVGLTAEAAIRTRTSPGPGSGSGSSLTRRTSRALPFFSYQAAIMALPMLPGELVPSRRSERRERDPGRLEPPADRAGNLHRAGRVAVQTKSLGIDPDARSVGGHDAPLPGDAQRLIR